MKRIRVWGLSAALAAGGWSSAAVAADPPTQTTLLNKLFGPKPPKPVGPTVASPVAQRPPTITAPLPKEVVADALRAEQDAYLRRLSVCTELRRVALERGDNELMRQADELERQTANLYNTRVAGLGVARVKAPLPESSPANPTLEAFGALPPVDKESRAQKLVAPAAPVPGSATAEVREVKP